MASSPITCKQCGHVNEGERVYCHNCGTKLERSILAQEPVSQKDTPEAQRRRVKKLIAPSRGFFAGGFKLLLFTVLWAFLAASTCQMVRPPKGVPPMQERSEIGDVPPLTLALEEAQNANLSQRVNVTDEVINKYLRNTIESKPGNDYLRFDRAFVNTREGAIRITAQQSIFGYPFYAGSEYVLDISDGRLAAANVGGNIGRLPIHPALMRHGDMAFKKLWQALDRERRLLDKMHAITLQKGLVSVTTKPPPPIAAPNPAPAR